MRLSGTGEKRPCKFVLPFSVTQQQSSSIRFLPKFVKFLLEAFFQYVRCTDQRLKGDFRFQTRLQWQGSVKHCS